MSYAGFTRQVWSWLADAAVADRVDYLGMPVPLRPSADARSPQHRCVPGSGQLALDPAQLLQLDSHDTARFRSVAGSVDAALVGAAWLLTWPGVPMIFAGDELGLEGVDNEDARRPMPWDPDRWDARMLAGYPSLIRLRRATSPCAAGACAGRMSGATASSTCASIPRSAARHARPRAAHPPSASAGRCSAAGHATALAGAAGPPRRRRGGGTSSCPAMARSSASGASTLTLGYLRSRERRSAGARRRPRRARNPRICGFRARAATRDLGQALGRDTDHSCACGRLARFQWVAQ
jgi:hypothetical protein